MTLVSPTAAEGPARAALPPDPSASLTWRLAPGVALDAVERRHLWRVIDGLVLVVQPATAGAPGPQYLARAQDLIGTDRLAGGAGPQRVVAITGCTLAPLAPVGARALAATMAESLAQSRRQGAELLQLRTGSLTDRVRHMLMLLGAADAEEADVELPPLRVLAELMDATPEAICRVLSGMRQLAVLGERRASRTRVRQRALRELVPPPGMSSGVAISPCAP